MKAIAHNHGDIVVYGAEDGAEHVVVHVESSHVASSSTIRRLTASQADELACALVQATPVSDEAIDNHGEVSPYLRSLPTHIRRRLALALLRSL